MKYFSKLNVSVYILRENESYLEVFYWKKRISFIYEAQFQFSFLKVHFNWVFPFGYADSIISFKPQK